MSLTRNLRHPAPCCPTIRGHQQQSHRLFLHATTLTKPAPAETSSSSSSVESSNKSSSSTVLPEQAGGTAVRLQSQADKIAAARELARRLAEERLANRRGDASTTSDAEYKRDQAGSTASGVAARQAAGADALDRAMRTAEASKQRLAKLQEENLLLKEVLQALAAGRTDVGARPKTTQALQTSRAVEAPPEKKAQQGLFSKLFPSPAVAPPRPAPPAVPPAAAAAPRPATPAVPPAAAAAPRPATPAVPLAAVAAPRPATPDVPPVAAAAPRPATPDVSPAAAAAPRLATPAVTPAAAAASPQSAPPAAPPPPPPQAVLEDLALQASRQSQAVFTFPAKGAKVGSRSQVFYNRAARNVLPAPGGGGAGLQIKAGVNKWTTILVLDLKPAPQVPHGEWYVADVDLADDVWACNYVVMGPNNSFDNNQAQDYRLPLVDAPTEAEVIEWRAAAYRAEEARVCALLDEDEQRLRDELAATAHGALEAGRRAYRARRDADVAARSERDAAARRPARLATLPAQPSKDGVFAWPDGAPAPGQRRLFVYNKGQGVMTYCSSVRLHLGSDGWWDNVEQVLDMYKLSDEVAAKHGLWGGQWWGVHVNVPEYAFVLDFVLSDREQKTWDNNGNADYHTRVEGGLTKEALAATLSAVTMRDGAAKHKVAEERAANQAVHKALVKGEAVIKRRRAQQRFLYTLPLSPAAGDEVEVHYHPESTLLRGRPEIFVRAGFSRKTAPPRTVLRLRPEIAGGAGFWVAKLKVPADASSIDLTFSDNEQFGGGVGLVDDNGGLEYHVPVTGGAPPKRLKVLHVAVEMAPIAKVGGMGDVVTALGRAVLDVGHDVEVILPKYDCINYKQVEALASAGTFWFSSVEVTVWKGLVEGLPTVFLDPSNGMFRVGCIYGRNDDANRFDFFCQIAMHYLRHLPAKADVVHAHDWQSAPVTWGDLGGARSVFTIHNLAYGVDRIGRAMGSCSVATTVSPTYAREISGNGAVSAHLRKLYGVLNGIDDDFWDPVVDPDLPMGYGAENVVEGKAAARKVLRDRLGLAHTDAPVVGVVTRLVAQKGMHLIKHAAWRALERGGQFVLLGSAPDPKVQAEFNRLRDDLGNQYPGRAALVFQYDEPLSHLIFAGSDMFLVPSIFEPCGLTQMIAMRYGSVPVVRKTGGLADTVFDVNDGIERARVAGMQPNGFSFDGTDTGSIDYALNRALTLFYDRRDVWDALAASVMRQDWSWNAPALDYIELYHKALK